MPHTLAQLEAFVSSPAYDAETAGLIALGVPELPRLKGEQIAPGITRIRGNLCNVHGRYGPCDKGLSGKKKPGKGRKPAAPKKTEAQRAAERAQRKQEAASARSQEQSQNQAKVLQALNIAPDGQQALEALRSGQQPDPAAIARGGFVQSGLVEQARDGSYRLSASGRAALAAASSGDAGRAGGTISSARDRATARGERTAAAAERKRQTQAKREQAAQLRAKRLAQRKPKQTTKAQTDQDKAMFAKMGGGGSGGGGGGSGGGKGGGSKLWPKGPSGKRTPQAAAAQGGGGSGKSDAKPKGPSDAVVKRGHDLAKQDQELYSQITALRREQDALRPSFGQTLKPKYRKEREAKQSELEKKINDLKSKRNALAPEIDANTRELHTSQKETSFQVFKDASGRYRWVAQSSTAFQDRDKEIVSTKALAEDCAFADQTGTYGPLRWWHTPGLDFGDCDFNAMHGRVLIESGTFKSEAIALKVAQAAPQLEISLGFLHLPTEPDASGIFHHIRRFERSLVPRGKASNRFTAFRVKEIPMLDATKVAALKTLGFSDDDITSLQTQAAATEKSADAQQVAYKADEPHIIHANGSNGVQPGQRFKAANGDEYIKSPSDLDPTGMYYATKAFPPSPPTAADAVVEEEVMAEEPLEEEAVGGLTLSPEDLAAIGEAIGAQIQGVAAQIMGALDLEKKVAGHVQGLMAPYQQQQATKDAADAERAEQVAALQTSLKDTQDKLNELLGLQPAVKAERASESATTTINPWIPQDAQLLESIKHQVSPNDQFAFGDLVENLFGSQTPGQA